MKVAIIVGSHREDSQSSKIARALNARLAPLEQCDDTYIFDLANNPLPLWDESIWNSDPGWEQRLAPIRAELESSDAFIIISPEWHGMAPAGLKNFFLLWGNGELAHKPALLVGVSSADGGSYPIAELRMSSYKNNRICYLPEHLIVRYVETVFNEDASTNNPSAQPYFEDRFDYCLKQLLTYAEAFRTIRASDTVSLETYGSGM